MIMMRRGLLVTGLVLGLGLAGMVRADGKGDAALTDYEPASGVSGNLSSVGSDTPALTEGTSNLGPMSRTMKDGEIEAFEAQVRLQADRDPVAIDALAVFVNKDNPIAGLTPPQIDAVFSSTRKCGYRR